MRSFGGGIGDMEGVVRISQIRSDVDLSKQRNAKILRTSKPELRQLQEAFVICTDLQQETQQGISTISGHQCGNSPDSISTALSHVIFWNEYCVLRGQRRLA